MPAIVPKKYDDMCKEFFAECTRLAESARDMYTKNVYRKLYVAGRKRRGFDTHNPQAAIWQEFFIVDEYEERNGWEIVIQEHIPRNYPFDQYAYWIQERLRREPMWIFAD